jgi:membrane protein implicated in regulation of membrane protease activity
MSIEATRAERLWLMLAGACMIVAATALAWSWNVEVAFVAATLGVVCWFLNLRNRLKKTIVNEVEENQDSGDLDENQ